MSLRISVLIRATATMVRAASVLFWSTISTGMDQLIVSVLFLFRPFRASSCLSAAWSGSRFGADVTLGVGLESAWFSFVHNEEIPAGDMPSMIRWKRADPIPPRSKLQQSAVLFAPYRATGYFRRR